MDIIKKNLYPQIQGVTPRHPTVRVLVLSTVGALSSSGTGQSGTALDRYCSLSGAPLAAALTSARTVRAL